MPRNVRASSPAVATYDVHPGVAMMQDWVVKLPEKTGRSLEAWVKLVQQEGPATEKDRRAWLKSVHGLGTNTCWWIAERAEGKGLEDADPEAYLKAAAEYVETMFAGGKAGLRPLFEELVKLGRKLGPDVRVCPCKTIVPLYREHVFAQLKPTTRTRLDLGLALGDTKAVGRLLDTGGLAKGDRITHRIAITCAEDIDAEVGRWLKTAYERDG
jgi:hypothetical protein